MNRREFVGGALTIGAASARSASANDRINVGFIGTGTRGGDGLIPLFLNTPGCQIVAVCDAWADRREQRAKQIEAEYAKKGGTGGFSGCRAYSDFRELLERKDIDAVVIATPDHWHIPLAILAARAGKDIYLEKPLGVSLVQAKKLREELAAGKRIFQYGTQQRGSTHIRAGCELVRNGRIGKVHTVVVLAPGGDRGGSTDPMPVPERFDFDMWVGPGPRRPYNDLLCKAAWPGHYYCYDYSLGFVAGWGAHPLDVAQWGLGADNTSPIEYEGTGYVPKIGLFTAISNWTVRARYPNGVTMHFMDDSINQTKFIGDEGWISLSRTGIAASPKSLLPPGLKAVSGEDVNHARDFIQAVRTRGTTEAPFEAAIHSDTVSHLSNIAIRTGRRIRWDPGREVILGDSEASKLLDRPQHDRWRI